MKQLDTQRLINLALSKRQLSFFVINCCREMIWDKIPDCLELYIDGLCSKGPILNLRENILSDIITKSSLLDTLLFGIDIIVSDKMFDYSEDLSAFLFYLRVDNVNRKNHDEQQHKILNDILVPRKVRSHLLSADICGLAKEIYEKNDWGLIPILRDALQDANFPVEYINHLKEPYHRRGCWVLEKLKNESTEQFS